MNKTIHTSRTIMFSELSKIMDFESENYNLERVMSLNVSNKLSKSNLKKTNRYLKQLYRFDIDDIFFKCFKNYWQFVDNDKKRIITLLYAITNDYLLRESIDLVVDTDIGNRVAVENFDKNIEKYHPRNYSENTRLSSAQNIASSWKQAGYIEGRVKNIRVKAIHDFYTVSFALLLSFLNGDRGDYILSSNWVKALALSTDELRFLIKEASNRDLLYYKFGGNVTVISFEKQLKKME